MTLATKLHPSNSPEVEFPPLVVPHTHFMFAEVVHAFRQRLQRAALAAVQDEASLLFLPLYLLRVSSVTEEARLQRVGSSRRRG